MKTKFYNQLFAYIAITTAFMVVIPIRVSANDPSYVTNVVFSSNSTGGQSSNGVDGQDGSDGADGQDGTDGRAGKNGQVINSARSEESLRIKSTINGVTVVDIDNSKTFLNDVDAATITHATSSSILEINEKLLSQGSTSVAEDEQSFIYRTLLQLRLMLITYVNKLF